MTVTASVNDGSNRRDRDRKPKCGPEPQEQPNDLIANAHPAAVSRPGRSRGDARCRPGNAYRVCGNPRSTLLVAGSGQRLVTTLPRV